MDNLILPSISETNGLSLITKQDLAIYSVGISTGGQAEISMAKASPHRRVIATTIDPNGAVFAAKQIDKVRLSDRIAIKVEDVSKPLSYPASFFDFIYARLVLHYLSNQSLRNALSELHRILKNQGKVFIVVRSKDCKEAQNAHCDEETGMMTYISKGQEFSRNFHTKESISEFLRNAGFEIQHTKTYDERLCVDFERTKPSEHVDHLIQILAIKSSE